MIDLCSHILWDHQGRCRSRSVVEEMLLAAKEDGIKCLGVAVPGNQDAALYQEEWSVLEELGTKFDIQLFRSRQYLLSTLIDLTSADWEQLRGSGFIFLNMNPFFASPALVCALAHAHKTNIKVVLAQPELSWSGEFLDYMSDFAKVNHLYIQVNTGSLLGRYGRVSRECVLNLIKRNCCHVLSNAAQGAGDFSLSKCTEMLKEFGGYGELLATGDGFGISCTCQPQGIK